MRSSTEVASVAMRSRSHAVLCGRACDDLTRWRDVCVVVPDRSDCFKTRPLRARRTRLHSDDGQEVRVAITFQRNTGMLVLAIWLILYGIVGTVGLALPAPLMAILAIVAGVLLLIGR